MTNDTEPYIYLPHTGAYYRLAPDDPTVLQWRDDAGVTGWADADTLWNTLQETEADEAIAAALRSLLAINRALAQEVDA